MPTKLHSLFTSGVDGVHSSQAISYPTRADRLAHTNGTGQGQAATALAGLPLGIVAYQVDTEKYYILEANDGVTLTWGPLTERGFPPTVIVVDASGEGQWTTITAGLAAASAGDTVLVFKGTYPESVVVPAGVTLRGFPGPKDVAISGVDTSSSRVSMRADAVVSGVSIVGPSVGANSAVDFSALLGGEYSKLSDCDVVGGGGAGPLVECSGAGDAGLIDITHLGGVAGSLLHTGAGTGTVVVDRLSCAAGTVADILNVAGPSRVLMQGMTIGANYTAVDIVEVDTGSFVDLSSILIDGQATLTNALHIVGDGVDVNIRNSELEAGTYDLLVDPSLTGVGSEVLLHSCEMRLEEVSVPPVFYTNANFHATYLDTGVHDDRTMRFSTGVSVGTPESPRELSVGEGDSTTRDIVVFSHDGAASWADNTAAAKSSGGATFSLWQAGTAGHVAYFGGSSWQFTGIKVDAGGVALAIGAGALVWEFWNGSAWTSFSVMVTDAGYPYDQKAQRTFREAASSDQIRFDWPTLVASWATTSVNGQSGYWVRCRIATAITTVPILQRIKQGTNRAEINNDGFLEFFGYAEPERGLLLHLALTEDDVLSPANASIPFTATITATLRDNRLAPAANDFRDWVRRVPKGIDTSRSRGFRAFFRGTSGTAGNIVFQFTVTRMRVGDLWNGTLADTLVLTKTVPFSGLANSSAVVEFDFTLPDLTPEDFLVFQFGRLGPDAADTYVGSVDLGLIEGSATFWR